MAPRVIVVGGGLSGLSAAHTVYQNGGNVVVLDKQNFFGGNSTKATSGINGALTRTQIDLGISDSQKTFYQDTLASARDQARPALVRVLVNNSASAVQWLQDVFNLDLTLVSRLGGHSQPRTHRGHDAKFPGMAITYALMQRLEDIAETEPDRVQIMKKARVTSVNKAASNPSQITGVTYERGDGTTSTLDGAVVLATGGYAADFTENSLLMKHRPEVCELSSTNGVHATGDGQKMLMAVGANGVDMDKVQVHPTGLVDPKDPESKWKFLAAEALRGEGGILLNSDGDRFVDELGHRDHVSAKMFEQKQKGKFPIRLVLNSQAASALDFHMRHYTGRGLMRKMTAPELAADIGCGEQKLGRTFADYNRLAQRSAPDPFGKKYFPSVPFSLEDSAFHVALMEPVLHFTMGGIEINEHAQVLNHDKTPFHGLYACGELAGGVHGANRLGGSSLLGCVVYGRVAGDSSTKFLMQQMIKSSDAARAGGGSGADVASARLRQISLHIDPENPCRISIEWAPRGNGGNSNGATVDTSTPTTTPLETGPSEGKPGAEGPATESQPQPQPQQQQQKQKKPFTIPAQEFSLDEIARHNKKDDLWIAVKGVVLDLTHWVDEHPGGAPALYAQMGRDASEEFAMLHDDEVIPKYAPHVVIGRVKGQQVSLEY